MIQGQITPSLLEESVAHLYIPNANMNIVGEKASEIIQKIGPGLQHLQSNLYNMAAKADILAHQTGLLNGGDGCDYDCGQGIYGGFFLVMVASFALTVGVFYLMDKHNKKK